MSPVSTHVLLSAANKSPHEVLEVVKSEIVPTCHFKSIYYYYDVIWWQLEIKWYWWYRSKCLLSNTWLVALNEGHFKINRRIQAIADAMGERLTCNKWNVIYYSCSRLVNAKSTSWNMFNISVGEGYKYIIANAKPNLFSLFAGEKF